MSSFFQKVPLFCGQTKAEQKFPQAAARVCRPVIEKPRSCSIYPSPNLQPGQRMGRGGWNWFSTDIELISTPTPGHGHHAKHGITWNVEGKGSYWNAAGTALIKEEKSNFHFQLSCRTGVLYLLQH